MAPDADDADPDAGFAEAGLAEAGLTEAGFADAGFTDAGFNSGPGPSNTILPDTTLLPEALVSTMGSTGSGGDGTSLIPFRILANSRSSAAVKVLPLECRKGHQCTVQVPARFQRGHNLRAKTWQRLIFA